MKKLVVLLIAGVLASAAAAEAQQPRAAKPQARATLSMRPQSPAPARPEKSNADLAAESAASLGQMTPEIWLYQQELRRYEDPRLAVRRKAEFRAWQRQRRIAALDWYGYSNARPMANPTPFAGGVYAPSWISNSYRHPDQWSGAGRTAVIFGSTW